jgi:hypothetical protein
MIRILFIQRNEYVALTLCIRESRRNAIRTQNMNQELGAKRLFDEETGTACPSGRYVYLGKMNV